MFRESPWEVTPALTWNKRAGFAWVSAHALRSGRIARDHCLTAFGRPSATAATEDDRNDRDRRHSDHEGDNCDWKEDPTLHVPPREPNDRLPNVRQPLAQRLYQPFDGDADLRHAVALADGDGLIFFDGLEVDGDA